MEKLESSATQDEIIRLRSQSKYLVIKYQELVDSNATLGERKYIRVALRKLNATLIDLENRISLDKFYVHVLS